MITAPMAVIRVGARTHDGADAGYWLVFPSDAEIPPNGGIVIRGRLPWPQQGFSAGVTLATKELDFAGVSDSARFPNRGR